MKQICRRFLSLLLCTVIAFGMLAGNGSAEQQPVETFAINTVHHGFRVYQTEQINYMGADLYFMEHEKSGARLVYVACDDQERAFGVSFRTQSRNDKGLPHVFEHTALSGSDKYPDSNLFFAMDNQTYSSYLNAETRQFATLYPTASFSEEQLFANMDVYMDGVLHPILLKDERAMMREAWHYNLDNPAGDITISGVVYSEMAANYGVLRYAAGEKFKKVLFPGSHCSNDCGGDPAVIPEMTYQELLDFHAKYYHPSNMLLMLYGDFSDIERFLEHLDTAYLSQYGRTEIILDDPDYTPAEGYHELVYSFPTTQNAETDCQTLIDYAFVLNDISYTDYTLASLAAVSLTMESSPMKQRMSELFPLSDFSVALDNDTVQPTLRFTLLNAGAEDAPEFKKAVDELLPVVTSGGVDRSVLNVVINKLRLDKAMAREESCRGVSLFSEFVDLWSRTGRPDAYMEDVRLRDLLKQYEEDGSLDTILGRVLENSPSSAMIVAIPEPGLAEKNNADLARKLADMKASMSEAEIQALTDQCADYNAWIKNNATVSLIDQVKVVDAGSLPEVYRTASVADRTENGVRYISSEIPGSEIFSMSVYLDVQGLPFESLLDASLAVSLMGSIGTENYSMEMLQTGMLDKINSLTNEFTLVDDADGSGHRYLKISADGLADQLEDTFGFMEEIALRTNFTDYDMIRQLSAANATMIEMYSSLVPGLFVEAVALAAIDPDRYVDYYTAFSPEFTQYNARVAAMNDEEMAELAKRLRDTVAFMMNRPGAIVTAIGSAGTVDRCLAGADAFLGKIGSEIREPVDYSDHRTLNGNIACVMDVPVACNYDLLNMKTAGETLTGQLQVAQFAVSDLILMPELRFRNNAYAAGGSIGSDYASLITQRDPNVAETYAVFASVPDKLRDLKLTKEQTDGYITAAYSSVATPQGPVARATEAINDALTHSDPARYLRMIREIKSTTPEDICAAAGFYEKLSKEGTAVSGLNEEMLSGNADLFDTVLYMTGN